MRKPNNNHAALLMPAEQRNRYCRRLPGLLNAIDQEMFYIVDTSEEARNLITGET